MVVRKLQLIVFGLDFTLWPFHADLHAVPPFRRGSSGEIIDLMGKTLTCYPEVPKILKRLHRKHYKLAVVFHTGRQIMRLFHWKKYITYTEFYPEGAVTHFDDLQMKSGISLEHMLYFDSSQRDIDELRACGVTSIYVRHGITAQIIQDGLDQYEREH